MLNLPTSKEFIIDENSNLYILQDSIFSVVETPKCFELCTCIDGWKEHDIILFKYRLSIEDRKIFKKWCKSTGIKITREKQ